MINKMLNRLDQPNFFGLSIHHSQKDHAETFLHRGVLEQLVQHDLRFGAALEFDHNAHAVAIAFIANVGNIVDDLVVDQLRDAFDQAGFVYLVGNFCDDDRLAVFVESLDRRP